jgi:HSP20 family molecular chaperone IbpA
MAKEMTTTGSELEAREKQALQGEGTRPGMVFRPDVDILEREDAYLIYADLPGVDEQHVQVNLEKGVLSLDGELATAPEEAWNPIHAEYHIGSYHREFRLSDEIDASRVSASMRDGVLELRLPKTEQHQPRQIEVRAG